MPNSYEACLLGLYTHIIKDVCAAFPTYHLEAERDLSRIHSLVEKNGIALFTLSFPSMGKHFDKCLSQELLTSSGCMGFKPYRRGAAIPNLFKGMWLRVFDYEGVLRKDPDINAIFFLRQLLYATKKLRITCDEYRTAEAARDFFRLDLSLRLPTLDWGGERIDCSVVRDIHLCDGLTDSEQPGIPLLFAEGPRCDPSLLDTIQRTADIVSTSLGWFDPTEWRAKHGPGAVSDGRVGTDNKFLFPTWPTKLDRVFPMDLFAFANASHWIDHLDGSDGTLRNAEVPSRLIAVPKTQKGPRLIAAEPTCNQWAQQVVRDFLESQVASSSLSESIRFRDQNRNRELARSASSTLMHWTIDLSSASDCVSCWLVERMFRRNISLLDAFIACRTGWVENSISSEPKYHKIRKFTTQGAAITFPTQTIIYAIVCIGTMLHELGITPDQQNIGRMARQVRVFGDDIIVPNAVGNHVVEVLQYLGFNINPSKTFGTGKFRESCGMECYDGQEVTPAYFVDIYDQTRSTTVSTIVECHNNFFVKGLWHTADWIKSTLPAGLQQKVPVVSTVSGGFGFKSFCGSDYSHLDYRWNSDLQRDEYRYLDVSASNSRLKSDTHASAM